MRLFHRQRLEFLKGDIHINPIAAKYAKGLSEKYNEVSPDEIAVCAEALSEHWMRLMLVQKQASFCAAFVILG